MKSIYCLAMIVLTTGFANAQVMLPLDASNCAIYNALKSDSSQFCIDVTHLGKTRGLIVRLDDVENTPEIQETILAQLPKSTAHSQTPKKATGPKIDYKAAKSESGYYIHFAFNSEKLEQEYRDHLDRLMVVLNSPSMKENCIKITGHTDTIGSATYNLTLSDRRAKSVYQYLTSESKIDKSRLTIAAVGETQPLEGKKGESPYNRRVEFSSKEQTETCIPKS